MKGKWTSILGLFSVLIIGLPTYAHARGGYGEFIGSLLITLLVVLVIFLILREAVCWYWKINETLSVLKEIRDLLASKAPKSANKTGQKKGIKDVSYDETTEPSDETTERSDETGDPWEMYNEGYCPECGAKIVKNSKRCDSCDANLIDYMG